MLVFQLNWSDEPGVWKDYRLADSRPIEEQLSEMRDRWAAARGRFQLSHDASFRAIELPPDSKSVRKFKGTE